MTAMRCSLPVRGRRKTRARVSRQAISILSDHPRARERERHQHMCLVRRVAPKLVGHRRRISHDNRIVAGIGEGTSWHREPYLRGAIDHCGHGIAIDIDDRAHNEIDTRQCYLRVGSVLKKSARRHGFEARRRRQRVIRTGPMPAVFRRPKPPGEMPTSLPVGATTVIYGSSVPGGGEAFSISTQARLLTVPLS